MTFGCHFPERSQAPFQLNYMLLTLFNSKRVVLRCNIGTQLPIPVIDSITEFFNSSNWLEREVWDLFWGLFS